MFPIFLVSCATKFKKSALCQRDTLNSTHTRKKADIYIYKLCKTLPFLSDFHVYEGLSLDVDRLVPVRCFINSKEDD